MAEMAAMRLEQRRDGIRAIGAHFGHVLVDQAKSAHQDMEFVRGQAPHGGMHVLGRCAGHDGLEDVMRGIRRFRPLLTNFDGD